MPEPTLRRRIAQLNGHTDAVRAMQRFGRDFSYTPRTGRELLATVVAFIGSGERLNRAARLADTWRSRYGYRFNIRDLCLLDHLAADTTRNNRMSPSQLRLEVSRAIAVRQAQAASPAGPALGAGRPVSFDQQAPTLTMADLWVLLLLDEMLRRPAVQQALRAMVGEDRADRTTQHGGLIVRKSGQIEAKLYLPAERRGDDRYLPSRKMLWDALDAACFFVGHFRQDETDPASFGPTPRELAMAAGQNTCGVVLTSLAGGGVNATYFNPEAVVVDLGRFAPAR